METGDTSVLSVGSAAICPAVAASGGRGTMDFWMFSVFVERGEFGEECIQVGAGGQDGSSQGSGSSQGNRGCGFMRTESNTGVSGGSGRGSVVAVTILVGEVLSKVRPGLFGIRTEAPFAASVGEEGRLLDEIVAMWTNFESLMGMLLICVRRDVQ
jgi:hypothetical protein